MVVITKADSWQEKAPVLSRKTFQPNEDMVIEIIGCEEKRVRIDVEKQDTHLIVFERTGTIPQHKPVMPDVDTEFYNDRFIGERINTPARTTRVRHSTGFWHTFAGFGLNLPDPGAYEARLMVEDKLVQTVKFRVETNSVP